MFLLHIARDFDEEKAELMFRRVSEMCSDNTSVLFNIKNLYHVSVHGMAQNQSDRQDI